MTGETMGMTKKLAGFCSNTPASSIPEEMHDHAKTAFMDWLAVTYGGKDEPLVEKLMRWAGREGGSPQATIIGFGEKKSLGQAALINGAASHALDYDDTLVSFLGHPSVTLFPALLALAEKENKSGRDLLDAYIMGIQVGGTIGACAGLDHYLAGWHGTSTLGHMASAAGCARLLGLDPQQTAWALGIGATQSSGLKRSFGTMCKPFHAGRASQSGLMAAMLARDGFTGADDVLEGPQGFFEALRGKVNDEILSMLGLGWDVVNLSQKYHASCHATHSPLEAARQVMQENSLSLDDLESIRVYSSEVTMQAAANANPKTGTEAKFSVVYCVANALTREVTGMAAFTDDMVNDSQVRSLMQKIELLKDESMTALESRVVIRANGRDYEGFSDILQQIPPLDAKQERVRAKFLDLAGAVIGLEKAEDLAGRIDHLESADMADFAAIL
ncbi:2-methylcitrate dehydratase PrpD [Desulfatibacillum alkenivorans DSM 16219]|jgi:2-methylcitrate dehydratase PrpD|uniref:2-methylcitrate dehydratase PrpD n=1 Tax=Desulfatibacillum alkenivorans DSM 16219 TaxID=1121393 RepID=A0A1M6CVV9_9BACT|nr:MmgE/PrpD family protein [Desulfatibacillum alkenivorans]SHI65126.1 2-methylcitrate dehydratase PrpD [Desulfatibacillum alkenivorans DSM 16219]